MPLRVPAKTADLLIDTVLQAIRRKATMRPAADRDPFYAYPQTPEQLNTWIAEVSGHRIPTVAVCPDHQAPMAFVWDFFAELVTDGLILAARATGKTEDLALLHLANGHFKPGFEISHIGAIDIQARRAYTYYRKGLTHPKLHEQAPDPHIRETRWLSGSTIEILPGTAAQTQGGHPYFATFDELEQGKRQPYENAKSMPVEWTDGSGRKHPGQFAACSTRESGLGMMQRALDEAEAEGIPIYQWCVFESMDGRTCRDEQGEPLCAECPLWGPRDPARPEEEWCGGRALAADGWRSRDEILRVFRRVSIDTWEAQHLCRKPDARALIYGVFSGENVTTEARWIPGAGPLLVWYDWGFIDNTAIGFAQYRDGRFYLFKELVGNNTSEREWVQAVVRVVTELEGYGVTERGGTEHADPTYEEWQQIWARKQPWPDIWPDVWPEAVAGDPSAPQLRSEFKEHGFSVRTAKAVKHEVVAGQDAVRAAILTAGGIRRLFVHPDCTEVIGNFGRYRAKALGDGSYSPKPDPDPANHAFSHTCDMVRYGIWSMRRLLGLVDLGGVKEGDETDGND